MVVLFRMNVRRDPTKEGFFFGNARFRGGMTHVIYSYKMKTWEQKLEIKMRAI